jgi:hypothetical protein
MAPPSSLKNPVFTGYKFMGRRYFHKQMKFVMAKIRPLVIWAAMGVLAGCAPGDESENFGAAAVVYGEHRLEKSIGPCQQEGAACLHIELAWQEIDSGLSDGVRSAINTEIQRLLAAQFSTDEGATTTPDASAALMAESFAALHEEMPDVQQQWSWESQGTFNLNMAGFLGYTLDNYLYTGGAHGIGTSVNLLFSVASGQTVSWEELFEPSAKADLLAYAESAFKAQFLQPNQTLADGGYWFPNEEFYLPTNFKVTAEGMIFRYEVYEIGPYAMGPVELILPMKDVGKWLRPEIKQWKDQRP